MQNRRSSDGYKIDIGGHHISALLRRANFARHRQLHVTEIELRKMREQGLMLVRLFRRQLETIPQRNIQKIRQILINELLASAQCLIKLHAKPFWRDPHAQKKAWTALGSHT